jgi:HEAT repeat protein
VALGFGGCGGAVSTGDLMGQSRSRDSADRAKAVRALGERAAEADAVVPVLIEALKDENAFVRRDAALALGRIGPAARPAAPALEAATRDRNAHVRRAASDALQKVKAASPAAPGK